MASVRAALMLLLPPFSAVLVVTMAARFLCRVLARKLSALARSQLACLPSGSGGGGGPSSSFRYLLGDKGDDDELPVTLYYRNRSTRSRRFVVIGGEDEDEDEDDDEEEECVFCLSAIEEGEEVRELRCRHLFHRACLDRWLRARPLVTCPLCRGRLLQQQQQASPRWEAADYYEAEEEEEGEMMEESDSEDMMLFMACIVHTRSSCWLWPS